MVAKSDAFEKFVTDWQQTSFQVEFLRYRRSTDDIAFCYKKRDETFINAVAPEQPTHRLTSLELCAGTYSNRPQAIASATCT